MITHKCGCGKEIPADEGACKECIKKFLKDNYLTQSNRSAKE